MVMTVKIPLLVTVVALSLTNASALALATIVDEEQQDATGNAQADRFLLRDSNSDWDSAGDDEVDSESDVVNNDDGLLDENGEEAIENDGAFSDDDDHGDDAMGIEEESSGGDEGSTTTAVADERDQSSTEDDALVIVNDENEEGRSQLAEKTKGSVNKGALLQFGGSANLWAPVLASANLSLGNLSLGKDLGTTSDMERVVTEMMLGKDGSGATPMGGSVTKIKKLLQKEMMPAVLDAHNVAQRELIRLMKDQIKCGFNKNVAWKVIARQKKKYFTSSPLHKRCRRDEAVKYTARKNSNKQYKEELKIKQLKCGIFAQIARVLGDGNRNRQIVKRGGSEATESYVRRISATICGTPKGKGKKLGQPGFLDRYLAAKLECQKATKKYNIQKAKCALQNKRYLKKKAKCNTLQKMMDGAACKRAVLIKDACETYITCDLAKLKAFQIAKKTVKQEETDRKAEWRGIKRMECLINGFASGALTNAHITKCKKEVHDTKHLNIKYPPEIKREICDVPLSYPATPKYMKKEILPLPPVAKGLMPKRCVGIRVVSTTPAKGSPKSCKCKRVTLNGPFSAGALVKCDNCWTIRRSKDKISCPRDTKLFAPRSRTDWQTFIASAGPLRAPHFVIDITRPLNGCGGCTRHPMNSGNKHQKSWTTADGAAWWLRSTRYNEPNGDYQANCYLDLWQTPKNPDAITWNDGKCSYHSKSYYCQPDEVSFKPKPGSPASCSCTKVQLAGSYSAQFLMKCTQCLKVSKATHKNSCPKGMKIFSPASRRDWKTFIASAKPLRAPHWIIDITKPSNGCGGCTRSPMNSRNPRQAMWKTSDKSPWWLRSTRYNEPNGDYHANCYLDLWRSPPNENSITFNDGSCHYRSRSYYCQSSKKRRR